MPGVAEGVERLELSCTVGGNVKWYNHFGKVWKFLLKLNIHLPSVYMTQ